MNRHFREDELVLTLGPKVQPKAPLAPEWKSLGDGLFEHRGTKMLKYVPSHVTCSKKSEPPKSNSELTDALFYLVRAMTTHHQEVKASKLRKAETIAGSMLITEELKARLLKLAGF